MNYITIFAQQGALVQAALAQGAAETTQYMVAGFAVIFGVMAVYLASLILERGNLQQELQLLEEIGKENQTFEGEA